MSAAEQNKQAPKQKADDDSILNLAKQVLAQQKPNDKKAPAPDDDDDAPVQEADLNLKIVEDLTKKLAQDLGTGFLDSDDEENDADEEDDAEFRKELMAQFRTLRQQSGETANAVSKQRIKQIYLQMLKSGSSLMSDKNMADQFLSKLDSQEISALMEVLRMDPEETITFFNKDPEVVDAIKNRVPLFPQEQGKFDLNEHDLLDSDDEEDLNAPMSEPVQEAIKVFEENLVSYTRNPAAILSLCDKLNEKDQQVFLNYIFKNYTPDKIEAKLKQKQQKQQEKAQQQQQQAQQAPVEVVDHALVAAVFKEVFSHFRAYKKQPQKFKPLIDRLNPSEYKAFEALVKAFWDITPENLKI